MDEINLRHLSFLEISSASALLLIKNHFYIIADDELHLSILNKSDYRVVQKLPLLFGNLPENTMQRKKMKPDFEALVHIPKIDSIIAIPSGSTRQRTTAVQVQRDQIRKVDFSDLYHNLNITDLNIEGAAVLQDELLLYHRGNGKSQQNIIVSLDLNISIREITYEHRLTQKSIKHQSNLDVGILHGQNLGITDVAVENENRIWFIAAAEDGDSTYLDGNYLGSVMGCLDSNNRIIFQKVLKSRHKPEGLALDLDSNQFYIVTDADDRSLKSELLVGHLII